MSAPSLAVSGNHSSKMSNIRCSTYLRAASKLRLVLCFRVASAVVFGCVGGTALRTALLSRPARTHKLIWESHYRKPFARVSLFIGTLKSGDQLCLTSTYFDFGDGLSIQDIRVCSITDGEMHGVLPFCGAKVGASQFAHGDPTNPLHTKKNARRLFCNVTGTSKTAPRLSSGEGPKCKL